MQTLFDLSCFILEKMPPGHSLLYVIYQDMRGTAVLFREVWRVFEEAWR